MALSPSLVDIFLTSLSQVQGPRSGPLGRVLSAKNVLATHYDPGSQPRRIKLQQRHGFTGLTTDVRSNFDGTTTTGDWSNPELLSTLDDQLVSICDSELRIFNGSAWSAYPNVRAVTNQLRQKITHTSNHTIQAPDHATLSGVTCYVWTETVILDAVPNTVQYIAIQSDDGAWLRTPQVLNSGDAGTKNLAKVVADPANQVFWVFYNSATSNVSIKVYGLDGRELASHDIARNDTATPGYWDVTYLTGGAVHYSIDPAGAQYTSTGGTWYFPHGAFLPSATGGQITISGDPQSALNNTFDIASSGDSTTLDTVQHPAPPVSLPYSLGGSDTITATYTVPGRVVLIQPTDMGTGLGVDFSTLTYATGTITETRVTDTNSRCKGPISWITNDTGDSLGYFATVGGLGDDPRSVLGFQATGAGSTHEFDTVQSIPQLHFLDSLIGWAETSNTHQPAVNIGIAYLADGSATTTGPLYDPGFRSTSVYRVDWANNSTFVKTLNSLIPVSRAFDQDGTYHAITYYQSGTGLTTTPTVVSVAHTTGDYMTGAQEQALDVTAGDSCQGPTLGLQAQYIGVTGSVSSTAISSGDKVELYTVVAGDSLNVWGYPVGTTVAKWTLTAISPTPTHLYHYATLDIASTSLPGAAGSWDIQIAEQSGHVVYTTITNHSGIAVTPGTFTGVGDSMEIPAVAFYFVTNLADYINDNNVDLFEFSGSVVISGASGGNNGTFGLQRLLFAPEGSSDIKHFAGHPGPVVICSLSTQTFVGSAGAPFTMALSPIAPRRWTFQRAAFDDSFIGANLLVTAPTTGNPDFPPTDAAEFVITATNGNTVNTAGADAAATVAAHFTNPLPSASINLPLGVQPYTFKLQSLGTLDYSFEGAYISVQGCPVAVDNGIYQVIPGGVDVANGLLYASPVDGSSDQVNRLFDGSETISVIKQQSVVAPWQSTWFMTPLTGSQAQVGKFETGVAYADWRVEGDSTLGPNEFPLAVGSISRTPNGLKVCLPYRAESVTSTLPIATTRGQINLAGASVFATTVGLKTFELLDQPGQACLSSGELLLPGPMAAELTQSGLSEDGINLSFEAPFLVSQAAVPSGQLGLTAKQKYQYKAVGEFTDESGNRIYSPPSPALNVQLTGSNGIVTIQGRSMNPMTTLGGAIAGTTSTSNRLVGISIYRTAITGTGANAEPTVTHFKITNDLAVNALAPTSSLNATGFTFPDAFTWQFVDQQPDITISAAESLYTDKQYLPRYPAPAFSKAVTWKGRTWVLAYDGSIWVSGEKTEGDAVWFHPALRIVLPTDDVPNALAALEDNLIVFCEGGEIWQLPATTFPDATGRNGVLPTPILLPFKVQCTGYAISLRGAVAFSSNDRGQSVWTITRDLNNNIVTERIMDSLAGQTINGMAVDGDQRLHVSTEEGGWFVYDQIVDLWTEYTLTTSASLVTVTGGQVAFQDGSRVFVYDPNAYLDTDDTAHAIAPDVTLADINFGTVRGLKSVWEFQLCGTYKGPHRLFIVISYPDEYQEPDTVFGPFTPDPSKPYVIPFNPMVEEATSYGIRVYVDFVGVSIPADSFEFELISAEVGVDRRSGIAKLPDGSGPTAT